MEAFTDFIFPLIPAILVFVAAFLFFDRMRKDHAADMQRMQKVMHLHETIPLRLKAIERLTIMLERIKPSALVMRAGIGTKSGTQLQLELLRMVREEFEHNVSMQMYVDFATWRTIHSAKEDVLEMLRIATSQADAESGALQLSRIIFEMEAQSKNVRSEEGLLLLRKEAAKI